MQIRVINDYIQWNNFRTQLSGDHLPPTFEECELLVNLGYIIYRLGAYRENKLVGVLLISITDAPLLAPFRLLNLKWMSGGYGPRVLSGYDEARAALLEEAHAIAKREHAVMLRFEFSEEHAQAARALDLPPRDYVYRRFFYRTCSLVGSWSYIPSTAELQRLSREQLALEHARYA